MHNNNRQKTILVCGMALLMIFVSLGLLVNFHMHHIFGKQLLIATHPYLVPKKNDELLVLSSVDDGGGMWGLDNCFGLAILAEGFNDYLVSQSVVCIGAHVENKLYVTDIIGFPSLRAPPFQY